MLNRIILTEKIINPSDILTELNSGFAETLNQLHTKNHDGMDVALYSIDMDTRKITFAGAKNPLILISNNKLTKIKGNSISIGGVYRNRIVKTFTNKELDLNGKSSIYIFSDGFSDQIGGKKKRKFFSRRFCEFLLSINEKPMTQQKEILNNTFEEWKGQNKQVDDVLVIGIKV
jgi:serine phosphatase RsbU (regulator of sigma subunit)